MDVLRQFLCVLLVFGLLGLALWKLRGGTAKISASLLNLTRVTRTRRRSRLLESVERLSLTPQHSLHLVRMNGREIVVATHPQGCSVLIQDKVDA